MWTRLLCLLACLWCAANVRAQDTAELHGKLALLHLAGLQPDDAAHARFLSLYNLPAEEKAGEWQEFLEWWVMQLSFSPTPVKLGRVDPKGRLLVFDIRELRWNRQAWATVNDRDPYMAEPAIGNPTAYRIRELTEHHQNRFGVGAIMRADFFVRDTMEAERSKSYYDLLYAEQRFVGGKVIDFPKDENDWNAAHGIAATDEFLKKARLDVDHGAVAPGMFDDPKGSIVTKSNRVLWFRPTPFGVAMKSFDTDTTSGDTDFLEKSPEISQGKVKFKAGELLATLPGGGQAALLIDGKGKRLELAGSQFAQNTLDARYSDVRTPMSCVQCHAPEAGLIVPRNLVEEIGRSGIDVKIYDKQQAIRFKQFWSGWERKIQHWQGPAKALTESLGKRPAAWYAAKLIAIRDAYDAPVDPITAAREVGVPLEQFKVAASYSPGVRLQQLLQGKSIPRVTWEKDTYTEAARLLAVDLSKKEK